MLYSVILVVIIIIFAVFTQILTLKAVKYGISLGQGEKKPLFELPKIPKRKTNAEIEEEAKLKRTMTILENIGSYNGDSIGQKDVGK